MMINRDMLVAFLVIGSLLLMPVIAGAHSATGECVNCHTMHDSQDGSGVSPVGPQPQLLKFSCVGCHAYTQNVGNGRSADTIAAPQVGPQVAGGGTQTSGGYFDDSTAHSFKHNVADITGMPQDVPLAFTPPGGSAMAAQITCLDCHDLSIGHAAAGSARVGDATSSYRMLNAGGNYVSGQGDVDFEVGGGQNIYNALSMNTFCANCHGGFHELTTGGSTFSSGAWIRHPTDVDTGVYGAFYQGTNVVVPVGDAGATGTNQVMCISCHRPHGNANPDMLRFTYDATANLAGDLIPSLGCETCHGIK